MMQFKVVFHKKRIKKSSKHIRIDMIPPDSKNNSKSIHEKNPKQLLRCEATNDYFYNNS
jgi:hypothetical protein